jgi:hypothetical protein
MAAGSIVTATSVTGAAAPFWTASARNEPIWNVTKQGGPPCGLTSAESLPWNIGRTKVACVPVP